MALFNFKNVISFEKQVQVWMEKRISKWERNAEKRTRNGIWPYQLSVDRLLNSFYCTQEMKLRNVFFTSPKPFWWNTIEVGLYLL